MTKQYDPENDDAADAIDPALFPFGNDDEIEDDEVCPACKDYLVDGECVNPFCTENPENVLDEDTEED